MLQLALSASWAINQQRILTSVNSTMEKKKKSTNTIFEPNLKQA